MVTTVTGAWLKRGPSREPGQWLRPLCRGATIGVVHDPVRATRAGPGVKGQSGGATLPYSDTASDHLIGPLWGLIGPTTVLVERPQKKEKSECRRNTEYI
jgi:hypothetical protein